MLRPGQPRERERGQRRQLRRLQHERVADNSQPAAALLVDVRDDGLPSGDGQEVVTLDDTRAKRGEALHPDRELLAVIEHRVLDPKDAGRGDVDALILCVGEIQIPEMRAVVNDASGIRPAPGYIQDPEGTKRGMGAMGRRSWRQKGKHDTRSERQYGGPTNAD